MEKYLIMEESSYEYGEDEIVEPVKLVNSMQEVIEEIGKLRKQLAENEEDDDDFYFGRYYHFSVYRLMDDNTFQYVDIR